MKNNTTTPTREAIVSARIRPRHHPRGRDWREYDAKTRIYLWPKGETIIDNLERRHSRPYDFYRTLLPQVFDQLGLSENPPKVHWSQKAGCSCGCSPGFIVERRLTGLDGRPIDIHVDIS